MDYSKKEYDVQDDSAAYLMACFAIAFLVGVFVGTCI